MYWTCIALTNSWLGLKGSHVVTASSSTTHRWNVLNFTLCGPYLIIPIETLALLTLTISWSGLKTYHVTVRIRFHMTLYSIPANRVSLSGGSFSPLLRYIYFFFFLRVGNFHHRNLTHCWSQTAYFHNYRIIIMLFNCWLCMAIITATAPSVACCFRTNR